MCWDAHRYRARSQSRFGYLSPALSVETNPFASRTSFAALQDVAGSGAGEDDVESTRRRLSLPRMDAQSHRFRSFDAEL